MFKTIAIINKSTVVSASDASRMATACNTQISRDVAPAWGRAAIPVNYYANENQVPPNSAVIYILNYSDVDGALGYHTETMSGRVFGTVFAKELTDYGLPVLYNPKDRNGLTVSTVLSHEVIELFNNPYVNLWTDGTPIAQGSEYAFEACDAVEANMYQISVSSKPTSQVSVSNFLYPEWFDTATVRGKRVDHLGLLTAPFTMTQYGYMIVRQGPGTETAIYGAKYPQILKDLKNK